MDYFMIKGLEANNQVEDTYKCAVRLDEIQDEIDYLRKNLSFKIKAKAQINERLKSSVKNVGEEAQGMSNMKEAMASAVAMYSASEAKIMSNAGDDALLHKLIETGAVIASPDSEDGWKLKFKTKIKYEGEDGKFGKRPDISGTKHGTYYDKETGKWKPLYDENGNRVLRGWASEKVKFFDYTYKYSDSVGGMTIGFANASWINTEAKAGISGGLYSADGKFAPGVKAEMGASFSLLALEAEESWGGDFFGSYAKGKVEFGSVGADASMTAALFSDTGPELHASGKLEAMAFEAEGHTGVTVFGADVGVGAGLTVGVGGHFDVGYADGKFRADVGAAAGLGFSLALEVDVTGTIEAVTGFASSAWDSLFGWI